MECLGEIGLAGTGGTDDEGVLVCVRGVTREPPAPEVAAHRISHRLHPPRGPERWQRSLPLRPSGCFVVRGLNDAPELLTEVGERGHTCRRRDDKSIEESRGRQVISVGEEKIAAKPELFTRVQNADNRDIATQPVATLREHTPEERVLPFIVVQTDLDEQKLGAMGQHQFPSIADAPVDDGEGGSGCREDSFESAARIG